MWIITVRSPTTDPREFVLPAGKLTIGRNPGSDIVLADESVAREHAELECAPKTSSLLVHDLGTTGGTFVNHERITQTRPLKSDDQIRIGQHLIGVAYRATDVLRAEFGAAEIQPLTRELLLESVEQHAVLLLEVSESLNTVTDLPKAIELLSHIMGTVLGVEKCQVILAEQFGQLAEWDFPNALAQRAIDERSVVAVTDVKARPGVMLSDSAGRLGVHSVIYVPVLIDGKVAALICIYTPARTDRQLSQDVVHLAVAIGHQASLVIQRARLLGDGEARREFTTTDNLTQIYNRRYLLQLCEHEVQRARRFQRPLSVILADIDHFKQLNDAHGLATGDEILRAVAARCRLAVRQADLVGRYDGAVIAILVLENDTRVANAVAERLRQQVASSPIYTETGLVHVTISLGIAGLSDRCSDLLRLLSEAAAALHAAKTSGRNRIEIAGPE